jgi:hypothetical protein
MTERTMKDGLLCDTFTLPAFVRAVSPKVATGEMRRSRDPETILSSLQTLFIVRAVIVYMSW